jgi:transposase InsO family protein
MGVARTSQLLMIHWYWPSLRQDVQLVLGTCEECKRRNIAFTAEDATLHPLAIMELGYRWGIDLLKLPASKAGYVRVIICVEHFSRYIVLIPLKAKSTMDTSLAVKVHVIGVFGAMAEVISDKGTEFAAEFHEMITTLGIDHRQSSAGRPQANGLAERMVQLVKKSVHKHVAELGNGLQWEMSFPNIALAYNITPQESTKIAPITVMMAQVPIMPPAIKHRFVDGINIPDNMDGDYMAAAAQLLARADLIARKLPYVQASLLTAQHRNSIRYARTHSGDYLPLRHTFKEGDLVFLFREARNQLQPRTRNPTVRITPISAEYQVTLEGHNGSTLHRHVKGLAPCHLLNVNTCIDPNAADVFEHNAIQCERCATMNDAHLLLLCDREGCEYACHLYCMNIALNRVPDG